MKVSTVWVAFRPDKLWRRSPVHDMGRFYAPTIAAGVLSSRPLSP